MNHNVYADISTERLVETWDVLAQMGDEQNRMTGWEYDTVMRAKSLIADVLRDRDRARVRA